MIKIIRRGIVVGEKASIAVKARKAERRFCPVKIKSGALFYGAPLLIFAPLRLVRFTT